MPATTTTCRFCGDRDQDKLADVMAIAKAISRGEDLGGIFCLGETLAKARVEIGLDGDTGSPEAAMAAQAVLVAQAKVAAEFNRLAGRRRPCRFCELRETLAYLTMRATTAVEDKTAGILAPYEEKVVDACEYLANYAGDGHPDPDATRAVLELARDVFLAALASASPERGPQ